MNAWHLRLQSLLAKATPIVASNPFSQVVVNSMIMLRVIHKCEQWCGYDGTRMRKSLQDGRHKVQVMSFHLLVTRLRSAHGLRNISLTDRS